MGEISEILIEIFLVAIITGVLVLPICRYLTIGWLAKRKDIMDGLNEMAREAYFEMFSRSDRKHPVRDSANLRFEQLYAKWYGRRLFVAPTLLLTVVAVVEIALTICSVLHTQGFAPTLLFNLSPVSVAALSGSYMWVVNDFTSRARRLDFAPADVHWGTLRLTIAIPMGLAFASVAAGNLASFIAFSIGAFPLTSLISILRRLATKNLGLSDTPYEDNDNVIKLQGMNPAIVERLEAEDINTITQIAYCDPVQVTMRSNLTFNFIIDAMNQALAWLYLGSQSTRSRLTAKLLC
jgi:hypothetical protein